MKTSCCTCSIARDSGPRLSRWQRTRGVLSWIVPSVILAAMPKCPVCVAAYVALFTGCGISLAAAGAARWLAITACFVFLAYAAVKTLNDIRTRRPSHASD